MHSLAMAQDILEAALSEAAKHDAKKINAISVKVADEHFTESDSLQFYLEAMKLGSYLGAILCVVRRANACVAGPPFLSVTDTGS